MLQTYRFTNVRREDDAVTKWVARTWREPNKKDPHLWFAMAVARLVNWPESLDEIGYPVPWDPARFKSVMTQRKASGAKTFSSAYIINQAVTGGYGMAKSDYLADVVLKNLWERRQYIAPTTDDSLQTFHARLMEHYGMGTFLAAQVVADVKYVLPLKSAPDWHNWAASGPGSQRGLNHVCGFDVKSPWREEEWLETLRRLRTVVNAQLIPAVGDLHAQDLQNCLCEFSKIVRGYSRQRYPGAS